jgi:hypothetical protein
MNYELSSMSWDVSKLVEKQQWLEDDKDGGYYCPTELELRDWDEQDVFDGWDIWIAIKLTEYIFEEWEIKQDESYSKYNIPTKKKRLLLMSDDMRLSGGIATMSREIIRG